MTISEMPEPALISVSLKFGATARGRPFPVYAVYVDGSPVGSSPYGTTSAILLPEGYHSVCVKIKPWVSDVVDLVLRGGDSVELVCAMKSMTRSKFYEFIQTKFYMFAIPIVLLTIVYPEGLKILSAFIEEHAKYEFLAVVFLTPVVGLFSGFKNILSRKPGAMLALTERIGDRDADLPREGSAYDVTFAEMDRLVSSGASPFIVGFPTLDAEGIRSPNSPLLDQTAANSPIPLPALSILASLNTVCVFAITLRWFPAKPNLMCFIFAIINGLLIGLLLAVQTWLVVWLKKRLQAKLATPDPWKTP